MKVELKEQEFQPVVITLETQEELDAVNAALSFFLEKTSGAIPVERREKVRALFLLLP